VIAGHVTVDVRDVMTDELFGIQLNENAVHAAQLMRTHGVGALVVYDYDRLAGIVTDRDIVVGCVAAGLHPMDCAIGDYMTANPLGVSPETSVEAALRLMGERQVRRLCVVEDGRAIGIVSLGDLAVRLAGDAALGSALARISEPVRSAPGRP
jgi:CBS domain-containing protein